MTIDKDWFAATLADAHEALSEALDSLENGDMEDAEEVLNQKILHVYAKLNYAVNTAELGASALETMDEDQLIAYPETLPFFYDPAPQPEGHKTSEAQWRSRDAYADGDGNGYGDGEDGDGGE